MFIDETDETDKIWIFPSIPNIDTVYINSGVVYVHNATGVLSVRGGKQLYVGGGVYIRGESINILHYTNDTNVV